MRSILHSAFLLTALAVLATTWTSCSTNPATGKSQLNLFSEQQEIAMGRQYAEEVRRSIGLYPDDDLQRYVQRIGSELAAASERPSLPWSFEVVDDASVNAFALPGGFIFLTRGIVAHMGSEAEMAGVLGHEIGHVTARHSVNQLSKAQLAQIGLIGAAVASPEDFRRFGDLALAGVSVMFLKFGRDDERQADTLGFDYMQGAGYPPTALEELFTMLARVGEGAGSGGRLPSWLSTHPYPEAREQWVSQASAGLPESVLQASWERGPYLRQVDGIVYGADPREGFFRDAVFYHPVMAFEIAGPRGWSGINQKQAVVWQSPRQDALFGLTLAQGRSPRAAADAFFQQQGIRAVSGFAGGPRGLDAVATAFETTDPQNPIQGAVTFLAFGDRVFQLVGYSRPATWRGVEGEIARAMASFGPLESRRDRNVEPMRMTLVTLDRPMTLRDFDRSHPSSIPLAELAVINHVREDIRLEAGQRVKRVVGGTG